MHNHIVDFLPILGLIGKGFRGYYSGKGKAGGGSVVGGFLPNAEKAAMFDNLREKAKKDNKSREMVQRIFERLDNERVEAGGKVKSGVWHPPKVGEKIGEGANSIAYITDRGTIYKKPKSWRGNLEQSEVETTVIASKLGVGVKVIGGDKRGIEMEDMRKYGKELEKVGVVTPKTVNEIQDNIKKIHKAGIYHFDLNEGNIFIGDKGGVKFVDFGDGGSIRKNSQSGIGVYHDLEALQTFAKKAKVKLDPRLNDFAKKFENADQLSKKQYLKLVDEYQSYLGS